MSERITKTIPLSDNRKLRSLEPMVVGIIILAWLLIWANKCKRGVPLPSSSATVAISDREQFRFHRSPLQLSR